MWTEPDLIEIGPNILKVNKLSNLINELDYTHEVLHRIGPLQGSLVIFNKQYFSKIQGIDNKNYTDISLKIHELSSVFVEEIKEEYFKNYTILKSEVSICLPKTLQGFHIDPRLFHRFSKRIHIPIKTNLNAFLEIGNSRYFLNDSSIWEFNNLKLHRAGNLGSESRTHIITDFIDNYVLETFLKKNDISKLYEIYK